MSPIFVAAIIGVEKLHPGRKHMLAVRFTPLDPKRSFTVAGSFALLTCMGIQQVQLKAWFQYESQC